MASITINAPGGGFLYSNSRNARLIITAETPDFDTEFVQAWSKEGFNTIYIPYHEDEKEYVRRLTAVKEGLSVGDNYGVIAFGDAAAFCLDYYLKPNNVSRLCALVCYYPTSIPDIRSRYPPSVQILTHLAGDTIDVVTTPTLLGLQGKKKRSTRRINPGIGTGELLDIGHRAYTYSDAQPGFAEVDLDEYHRLDADLAFTRTLEVLRKAYGREGDLEQPWEEHLQGKFFSMNLSDTMSHYTKNLTPTVTYVPTLSGGTGARALRRFYDQYFLHKLPPSMHLRLISRTVGADRVVDELYVSFEHTQEIPWMLPGVPPTNRKVEIVLVSIVSMRAKQLYSEHIYWDQASVLVQVGLLDPKLVPKETQEKGVDRLPVIGREAARRILDEDPEVEEPEFHNRLIRRSKQRRESGRVADSSVPQSPIVQSEAEGSGPKKGKKAGPQNGEQNGEKSGILAGDDGEGVKDGQEDGDAHNSHVEERDGAENKEDKEKDKNEFNSESNQ
ncbi:dienelactone hydrolase [Aspergillus foveolatus]|uniref:dienelactone hydrolase n=1 Tax=Aspergillus foveolatus TaxID=210207 RepID=UPI003CCCAC76